MPAKSNVARLLTRAIRPSSTPHPLPIQPVCHPFQLPQNARPWPCPSARSLHSSPTLYKKLKGGKQESKRTVEKAEGTVQAAGKPSADPNDFSQLHTDIAKAQTLMQENLAKLRSGGRFNHELLEGLKVQLDKKDGGSGVKLGDLAQVVPRGGRQIVVMVGEQDYVKPVNTAIVTSPYSLNPTPNPQNPLELQITIPPPTAESRKQVIAEAEKAGEKTYHTIRQARGAQQKKMNAMEKAKAARPDDMHKARQNMEKVVEDANKAVKETLAKAKKALEG